jgi:hypothetical protein
MARDRLPRKAKNIKTYNETKLAAENAEQGTLERKRTKKTKRKASPVAKAAVKKRTKNVNTTLEKTQKPTFKVAKQPLSQPTKKLLSQPTKKSTTKKDALSTDREKPNVSKVRTGRAEKPRTRYRTRAYPGSSSPMTSGNPKTKNATLNSERPTHKSASTPPQSTPPKATPPKAAPSKATPSKSATSAPLSTPKRKTVATNRSV